MLTFNTQSKSPCVRYFYLPANPSKQSEIIEVLNSSSNVVQVPMREEDMELTAFFERRLTARERASCKNNETWKVFTSWDDILDDHIRLGLKDEVLHILQGLKYRYALEEESMAVSA